jgi:Pectate lyase superfamily protein
MPPTASCSSRDAAVTIPVPLEQASLICAPHTAPQQFQQWISQLALNVKGFGAKGDGVTDDTIPIQACLNVAYGPSGSPHGGANAYSNLPVFFPNGNYRITSPLTLRSVRGARMYGAGRFTTTIRNTAANGSVFVTNGFEYSRVEGMQLVSNGSGVCFDLDWDGTGPTALQSNTFADMFFGSGAYGLRIGQSGNMGSETLISNCFCDGQTVAGLATRNFNACDNTIIGGDFQSCVIGIWVFSGAVETIHGVSFQGQSDTDIAVDNQAGDVYSIAGCRTESTNFLRLHNGTAAHVAACTQTSATAGIFAFIEAGTIGSLCADNCRSQNGIFTGNGNLYLRGSSFGNAGYLGSFGGTVKQNI